MAPRGSGSACTAQQSIHSIRITHNQVLIACCGPAREPPALHPALRKSAAAPPRRMLTWQVAAGEPKGQVRMGRRSATDGVASRRHNGAVHMQISRLMPPAEPQITAAGDDRGSSWGAVDVAAVALAALSALEPEAARGYGGIAPVTADNDGHCARGVGLRQGGHERANGVCWRCS